MNDCTVLALAGGNGTRMGGLGALMPKAALVAYDWPLLLRALHQMHVGGFPNVLISTNSTFYSAISEMIASYRAHAPERLGITTGDLRVIENPMHVGGPLPALAEALKAIPTPRCLLYLADEFQVANPFPDFAAVVNDSADYLGGATPLHRWEMTGGGMFYADEQQRVYSVAEKPNPNAPDGGYHWTGVALFNTQDLAADLDRFFTQYSANMAVGEIFEFRRALGKPVRAIHSPDFLNVNNPQELLLAGLYVALERNAAQPALCAALAQAAAQLRARE